MNVQCFSTDKQLLDKLLRHLGEDCLEVMSDTQFPNSSDLELADVAIIDLKYHSLVSVKMLNCPVISLAEIPNFTEALAALKLGVLGYGNRQMRLSNIEQAIENVLEGQIWLPPSIVTSLIGVIGESKTSDNRKTQEDFLDMLSKREKEVALCIGKGLSNQETADKLYVSIRTVKAHLSSIYAKTGIRNRLELGLSIS